jgi:AraC family transcriptional regulator, transcriptional activator of pobA
MSEILIHTNFNQSLNKARAELTNDDNLFHIFTPTEMKDKHKKLKWQPTRQCFYDISFFIDTKQNFNCADKQYRMDGSYLQLIGPRQVQSFEVESEELQKLNGFTIFFKPEFLSTSFDNVRFNNDFHFFNYTNLNNVIKLSSTETKNIYSLGNQIYHEYYYPNNYSLEIIKGHLWVLLFQIKRILDFMQTETMEITNNRPLEIVSNFKYLLTQNVSAKKTVEQYADEMCISAKHLSQTLKGETGQSAKDIILEALVLEAKTLLCQTNMNLSEIALKLNFEDNSYFSKFFKRETGKTPTEFRFNL